MLGGSEGIGERDGEFLYMYEILKNKENLSIFFNKETIKGCNNKIAVWLRTSA